MLRRNVTATVSKLGSPKAEKGDTAVELKVTEFWTNTRGTNNQAD